MGRPLVILILLCGLGKTIAIPNPPAVRQRRKESKDTLNKSRTLNRLSRESHGCAFGVRESMLPLPRRVVDAPWRERVGVRVTSVNDPSRLRPPRRMACSDVP